MSDKEAVKVIVRCRPMNEREDNLNCKAQFEKKLFSENRLGFQKCWSPHLESLPPSCTSKSSFYSGPLCLLTPPTHSPPT